jgi:Uma2 family endonuclease
MAAPRLTFLYNELQVLKPQLYTEAEYFAFLETSDKRADFVNGRIVADAGGTDRHAEITAAATVALGLALKGKPCKLRSSDIKIKTKTANYRFADLSVVCGKPQFHNDNTTILINPSVIVEVVSPESRNRDYLIKPLEYFEIESLLYYIVVEQATENVTVFMRDRENDGLLFAEYNQTNHEIILSEIEAQFSILDFYI